MMAPHPRRKPWRTIVGGSESRASEWAHSTQVRQHSRAAVMRPTPAEPLSPHRHALRICQTCVAHGGPRTTCLQAVLLAARELTGRSKTQGSKECGSKHGQSWGAHGARPHWDVARTDTVRRSPLRAQGPRPSPALMTGDGGGGCLTPGRISAGSDPHPCLRDRLGAHVYLLMDVL